MQTLAKAAAAEESKMVHINMKCKGYMASPQPLIAASLTSLSAMQPLARAALHPPPWQRVLIRMISSWRAEAAASNHHL